MAHFCAPSPRCEKRLLASLRLSLFLSTLNNSAPVRRIFFVLFWRILLKSIEKTQKSIEKTQIYLWFDKGNRYCILKFTLMYDSVSVNSFWVEKSVQGRKALQRNSKYTLLAQYATRSNGSARWFKAVIVYICMCGGVM